MTPDAQAGVENFGHNTMHAMRHLIKAGNTTNDTHKTISSCAHFCAYYYGKIWQTIDGGQVLTVYEDGEVPHLASGVMGLF